MIDNNPPGLSEAKRALLQQRIRGTQASTQSQRRPVARPHTGPTPLSVVQEQLWYFSQLAPENPVYNEAACIRKRGEFDLAAFQAAFDEIVERHQIWRSTFNVIDDEPMQVVHPPGLRRIPMVDLTALPPAEKETRAAAVAAEQARQPYDLAQGPLVRPLLVRVAPDDHRLYLALHHMVFDGVSLYRVILPELIALYNDVAAGRPPSLRAPMLQYADYALWSREQVGSEDFAHRIAHWQKRLAGAPTVELPLDRPRPLRQTFRGGMEWIAISKALADDLRSLSRSTDTSLFQVVAAAFAVLLQRYSGQDDLVFGTFTDLRQWPELETVVGYCLTPLVIRADCADDPAFTELLRRVRGDILDGLQNVVPFERLVRELQPPRDPSANPIFQAAIVLEPATTATDPSWSLHLVDADVGSAVGQAKFDLHIELDERPDGRIDGRLMYSSDLFDAETGRRMAGHWQTLLAGIAANPTSPISTLPMLADDERRTMLVDWNATQADYPRDACVQDLIAEQVRRTPHAIAAEFGDEQLTYAQLHQRAQRVARRLRSSCPGTAVVAIYVERSFDMLVGMLGTWMAGAAYLPLDQHYPADRIAFMLEDSGAEALLTQRPMLATLPDHRATVICLDDEWVSADEDDQFPEQAATNSSDAAYLLYTSGSTGKPKGVRVQQSAVVNLLTTLAKHPGLDASDIVLAVTTYAFDIAAVELWLPLVVGARTVITPREISADGRRLAALIHSTGATMVQITPSQWQMLVESGWTGEPGLVAWCGGEALSQPLAEALLERTAALWNMFGPTETTVWSTTARLEKGQPVTIGRPIANTRVYVLDQHRQPVPVGVHGELWIGGEGVTTFGYLHRPEESAERFVDDPFVTSERMYRTGDLVRWRADGQLQYLGRLDHQVKVRGFRIELGEIETALLAHDDIVAAVVVAREDTPGDQRLVAYFVARSEPPTSAELASLLHRTLPDYMVPAAFVSMDALPLTPNRKIDRKALPAPDWTATTTAPRVAPRSDFEQRLASIWAATLSVDEVGVHDDFFELGGHSLLAVRLLANVEREIGVDLPLAAFFAGGTTVAGMASIATGHSEDAIGSLAVPIQFEGSSPVLFFVQPDESNVLALRHFTAPLGPDQRLMGLLPERVGRRFDRSKGIEDLATPMLDTIRRVQPHGPYYLAGFSLGALLAYELAGRLRAAGEPVPWLAVLDCPTPASARRWLWLTSPRGFLARIRERGLRRALRKVVHGTRRVLAAPLTDPASPAMLDDFDWDGATVVGISYACPPNDVPMELFVSDDEVDVSRSRSLGWDEVHQGPITIHEIPGVHLSLLTEPHVTAVAEALAASLRRAQSASATPSS